ncbi:hypothetical protein ERJ75_000514100 [Trypanosoma vivax]|nr:hypothetical protein TRVL_04372 [Trypanosoma vivax]KAH8616104.1 hypothetical protein ERJ75_000514100 [Trypanosoma vivax]
MCASDGALVFDDCRVAFLDNEPIYHASITPCASISHPTRIEAAQQVATAWGASGFRVDNCECLPGYVEEAAVRVEALCIWRLPYRQVIVAVRGCDDMLAAHDLPTQTEHVGGAVLSAGRSADETACSHLLQWGFYEVVRCGVLSPVLPSKGFTVPRWHGWRDAFAGPCRSPPSVSSKWLGFIIVASRTAAVCFGEEFHPQ